MRMHIMHVIDSLAIGGAERMLVEIANHTVRDRVKVSVCVTRSDTTLAGELDPNIPIYVLNRKSRFDFQGLNKFAVVVRNEKVDIFHVHNRSSFGFVAFANLIGLVSSPIILHDHFGRIEIDDSVPVWFRLWAKRKIAHYVGVTKRLAEWAQKAGIPLNKISVIENAINLNRICNARPYDLRQDLKISEGTLVGVFVGGLRREKGLEILIEALSQSRFRSDIKILVIGVIQDELYFQACKKKIIQKGLSETIIFLGGRSDVPRILKSVDFAVIPSISESGPIVLIEYLATGLPFVATKVGAISQRAKDLGVPGFVPPNDIKAFAEALDELLSLSPTERADRGSIGREIAFQHFDIQKKITQWYEVYTHLFRGSRLRLLIISNTAHYNQDGRIVGWGPTVQEIDALAQIFDSVYHIGCLYSNPAPPFALPYSSERVHFIGIPPAGGDKFKDKLGILYLLPIYLRRILKEIPKIDVIHIRCPANISLMTIILLSFLRYPKYRWVKYAGNWQPKYKEPSSYTFQRFWLKKNLHRGVVTINGYWNGQPKHIYSLLNPCLTQEEVEFARTVASNKELIPPYKLLFVGRVESNKGVGRILKIAKEIHKKGISFRLDIIGDGPERKEFEIWTEENELSSYVTFYGWLPKTALSSFYARAHFLVFPSSSEGWPKVISEAMAYGVVPIVSNISSIPQVLSNIGIDLCFSPNDIYSFVQAILDHINHPERWKVLSQAGIMSAKLFTYEEYLQSVKKMFWKAWKIKL